MLKGLYVLGPMFFIFWIIKPKWLSKFRIEQPRDKKPILLKEFLYSIIGLSVYLIPLYLLMVLQVKFGYTKMYMDPNQYGKFYFYFSFLLFAVIVDTWFYWIHRAMHTVPLLMKFHKTHHNSYNINPLTSYSFHLGEALLNMLSYAFFVLVIPFHPAVLLFFGTMGILYNGYIHLGYDIPEKWRNYFPPLKIMYSARQHAIHHHEYAHNYAVYFRFWDKIMGTERIEPKASR